MWRRSPRGCSSMWLPGLQRNPALPAWCRWHSGWMLVSILLGRTGDPVWRLSEREDLLAWMGISVYRVVQSLSMYPKAFFPVRSSCLLSWKQSCNSP